MYLSILTVTECSCLYFILERHNTVHVIVYEHISDSAASSSSSHGLMVGVAVGLSVMFLIIFLVLLWCYKTRKGSNLLTKFNVNNDTFAQRNLKGDVCNICDTIGKISKICIKISKKHKHICIYIIANVFNNIRILFGEIRSTNEGFSLQIMNYCRPQLSV